MSYQTPAIFIVIGMHRSGTSFVASLLQSAGLNIGQQLIGPGNGNIKGFFESIDFVDFHQTVLHSQGINEFGWTLQEKFNVEDQYVIKAKEIIDKHSESLIWGWKDPRTTLFLDFWLDLLPDAFFLLIYRSPWEVADSLYRRGDELFLEHPELAIKIWMHYNQKILDFYDRFGDRCYISSVSTVANDPASFIREINTKFKVNLATPQSDIYDKSLFHTQESDTHRSTLVSHYFPQALDIYQELNVREASTNAASTLSWLNQIESTPYRTWAFQDWVSIRRLERQVRTLTLEVERSHSQLQQVQVELEALTSYPTTNPLEADVSEED